MLRCENYGGRFLTTHSILPWLPKRWKCRCATMPGSHFTVSNAGEEVWDKVRFIQNTALRTQNQ